MATANEATPWRRIVVYSLPAAGVNFMENLIAMFLLKFAADVLLLAPALVASFFGVARVWDAVSDPIVGYWSDRTRLRMGRRRPWILASAVPLALSFGVLWSPPRLAAPALGLWVGTAILLFFTAQAAFQVPHLAWGAELAGGEHDRSRVFGGRLAVGLLGAFGAAIGMVALERAADPRSTALVVAVVAGVATCAACVLLVVQLRERPEYQGRGGTSPRAAFGDVLRNPHARLLIAVFFLEGLGFAAMTTTMPFYIQYVAGRTGDTGLFMGGALTAMLVTIPVWLALARCFGKRRVWLGSLVGRAAAFAAVVVLPADATGAMVVDMLVIGSLFGCGAMLGPSLEADVIEDDERRTGERKEGAYFAAWNLAAKGSAGAAIVLSGIVLQLVAFEPNAVQQPAARAGIVLLFGGFPALFYLVAAALLARLSLASGRVAGLPAQPAAAEPVGRG
jgi:GPH family glycoside/pentoside/hexuronide:cation symporter